MKKISLSPVDLKNFKNSYKTMTFETEVISNTINSLILQSKENPELFSPKELFFLKFYSYSNNPSAINTFFSLYLSIQEDYLTHTYGKADYNFKGNRIYKNYLFEHNGHTFIMSNKSEHILDNNNIIQFQKDLLEFLMIWYQNLIDFVISNKNNTKYSFFYNLLNSAQIQGEVDENYQLIYS